MPLFAADGDAFVGTPEGRDLIRGDGLPFQTGKSASRRRVIRRRPLPLRDAIFAQHLAIFGFRIGRLRIQIDVTAIVHTVILL